MATDLELLLRELDDVARDFYDKKATRQDTGFNVFYLISDYYYRETFHGDILYALLSPEEKHNEGDRFVRMFIEMINKARPNLINETHYRHISVQREVGTIDNGDSGRIDILIVGKGESREKHCIVIENKLNDASDTYRQLPKYNNYLKTSYIIDAFLYLPLSPRKKPNTSAWTEKENEDINKRLVIIPAYEPGRINLIDNWLIPAEIIASNEDAKFIIKQYHTLLNNLTIDIMDANPILDVVFKESHLESAFAIVESFQDICKKVIEVFIDKMAIEVSKEGIGVLSTHDQIIDIDLREGWHYYIERYNNNGMYNRYVKYLGAHSLPTNIKSYWSKLSPDYPLGWDYFADHWCYWDKIDKKETLQTLRDMRNGKFPVFIINELIEVKQHIGQILLGSEVTISQSE